MNELVETLGHEDEPAKSYRALVDYALMEHRSLAELAKRYTDGSGPTKRLTTLKKWSGLYRWQHRVAQYDLAAADAKAELWQRRKAELNEKDWSDGMQVRSMVIGRITASTDPLDLSRLVGALSKASELQRLACDAPTIIAGVTGAALDALLAAELIRVANPQQARGPRQIAGYAGDEDREVTG